jgi:hypothetical protein
VLSALFIDDGGKKMTGYIDNRGEAADMDNIETFAYELNSNH